MDARKLTDDVWASPQLALSDMPEIAKAGFRSVICNRPDGEGADQHSFEELKRAAGEAGLEARYLPAEPGKVSDDHAKAFGLLLEHLPKPVLAFCRTGTRAATMWALSESKERSAVEILATTLAAGFDLESVRGRLSQGPKG